MKKFIVMVSLVFSVLGSIVSYADEWKQDATGWQYVYNDGTILKDNWFTDPESGEEYHFDSNGYMQTGIVNINGKDHYFNDTGVLLVNGLIPDGRMADRNGEIINDVNDGVTFLVVWLPDVKVGNSKVVAVGIKNISNKPVTVKNKCDVTTNEKTTTLSLYNPDTHSFYDERTINPNETVNMSFINPNLSEFYMEESSSIMFPVQIDGKLILCYVNEHTAAIMHKSQEELNRAN
ncbi:MAG: putative cell wall binding repeat [Lacrimispora sp.]|jgi:hypothetical protein|nr:putative cell wall binding repeat [Lacrimispora sp.]